MSRLLTEDRVERPDDLYNALVDAHDGLTPEQSRVLNARLILLLANHIGDQAAVEEAIRLARAGIVDA